MLNTMMLLVLKYKAFICDMATRADTHMSFFLYAQCKT